MKIKETVERDCCAPEDLLWYKGSHNLPLGSKPKFCRHCGQIWILITYTDAAGDTDTDYFKFIPRTSRKELQ